jgi:hypothetical protein
MGCHSWSSEIIVAAFGAARFSAVQVLPPEPQESPVEAFFLYYHGHRQVPVAQRAFGLCHEYRRSKRCCVTVRKMKEGPSCVRINPEKENENVI